MTLSEAVKILCDPELIEIREMHIKRLEALFAGEKPDYPFYLYGETLDNVGFNDPLSSGPFENCEKWVDNAIIELAEKAECAADRKVFRPLSMQYYYYGVHFGDKIFGADVFFNSDINQWWSKSMKNPIGELLKPDMENNETWKMAKRLSYAMTESGAELPFISHQVIGSSLNLSVNLYKQRLLYAFYECPDEVKHDLRIINDVLKEMFMWYQRAVPDSLLQATVPESRVMPRGSGQIDGCTTQLVSPDIYREYFAPLDDELLSLFPNGGMIHLCGASSQHIKCFSEMEHLKIVQLNDRASEDIELYAEGLRDDQIIYFIPTINMTIEKALDITKGMRLVINADMDESPEY